MIQCDKYNQRDSKIVQNESERLELKICREYYNLIKEIQHSQTLLNKRIISYNVSRSSPSTSPSYSMRVCLRHSLIKAVKLVMLPSSPRTPAATTRPYPCVRHPLTASPLTEKNPAKLWSIIPYTISEITRQAVETRPEMPEAKYRAFDLQRGITKMRAAR